MEFKRVNGRIDINSEMANKRIKKDEEEQRGVRPNKFWFNNYEYLYKDVYQKTYEDYAEIIAYKLAEHLGVECASYDLAVYNGNIGVITKNLVKDNENEELLSGTEIIGQVYSEYIVPINNIMKEYDELTNKYCAKNVSEFNKLSPNNQNSIKKELLSLANHLLENRVSNENTRKEININSWSIEQIYDYLDSYKEMYNEDFTDMKNGIIKSNNLYDIWNVLEVYSIIRGLDIDIEADMNKLINMFIFDIITSQGDRHADNWSIIINHDTNSMRLCPLYDNSGICGLSRERAIKNIVDYKNQLNDPYLNEVKKERVKGFINKTINHSNSGLKVDYNDVDSKHKNIIMVEKFFAYSSDEFCDRFVEFANKLDDSTLDFIFLEIENKLGISIPDDVKTLTKTVIHSNLEMINQVNQERIIRV